MELGNFITMIPAVETVPARLGFPGAAEIQKITLVLGKKKLFL
jgi:hypothetical protein